MRDSDLLRVFADKSNRCVCFCFIRRGKVRDVGWMVVFSFEEIDKFREVYDYLIDRAFKTWERESRRVG